MLNALCTDRDPVEKLFLLFASHEEKELAIENNNYEHEFHTEMTRSIVRMKIRST